MRLVRFRVYDRFRNCSRILAVRDALYLPAVRFKALLHILGEREVGVALNRDLVSIVE